MLSDKDISVWVLSVEVPSSVDMCNGDTVIGHTVGTVYAIGQYYGSTAIAHDSTTVVTSYMYDPLTEQDDIFNLTKRVQTNVWYQWRI